LNRADRQTSLPQIALGQAIRKLRKQRGASLEALAPEAGISLNMLSLIERGEANPTWNSVHGIARALGISMAELAKLAEEHKS
jgi:transcriptional regulator with XRE-family HTH domain